MGRIIWAHFLTCLMALGVRASLPVQASQAIVLSSNDTNEIPDIIAPVAVKNEPRYRLSDLVKPKSYEIDLWTFVGTRELSVEEQSKFNGTVQIDFDVDETSEKVPLTLHSVNLTVLNCKLEDLKGSKLGCTPLKPGQTGYEEGYLTIKEGLDEGMYTLKIKYKGVLSNDMQGFYRSSYRDEKGNNISLATTQFEPVGARRAFPCFDEPGMKATFNVNITHYEKYSAISNTNISKVSKLDNGMVRTSFKTTPIMSTYLLAFIVSDFKQTKVDGFTSIWAKENAGETTKYATETSAKLLKALDDFTKIKFSEHMTKMDHAAIPDFKAGAMENWGLITYREKSLLYDHQTSSTAEKQNIIETIAHELAHQWFGDLVTLEWWDYTWLNEGFANFFQSYITDKVEPGWRSVNQAVIKSIQSSAFDFDGGNETHPLNLAVETPDEISNKFDTISYQKGGAVIRMMQHFLTEEVFQEGLQKYLKDHQKSSTSPNDLFESLQEVATNKNIKLPVKMTQIMNVWVEKAGYPVINMTRSYGNGTKDKIEQQRFFSFNASEVSEEDKNTIWYVPINCATAGNMNFSDTKPAMWMSKPTDEIDCKAGPEDWVILNKQQTGYYRVAYDEKNWKLIANYLNSANDSWKNIHVLNRAQLINDAFAFAKLEQLSLPILLNLTAYLKNETDHIAWYPAYKVISWLDERLMNTALYDEFKAYYQNNLKAMVDSVGLEESESEEDFNKLARIPALKWACYFGHTNCTTKMNEKLVGWLKGVSKISADLREITLCHGMWDANEETWNLAFNKSLEAVEKADTEQETKALISALACSRNASILGNYLDRATDKNASHDFLAIIKDISQSSPIGVNVSLDYLLKKNLRIVYKLQNYSKIAEAFRTVAERITNDEQYQKLVHADDQIPAEIRNEAVSIAGKRLDWYLSKEKALIEWTKTLHPKHSGVAAISSVTILIVSVVTMVLNCS